MRQPQGRVEDAKSGRVFDETRRAAPPQRNDVVRRVLTDRRDTQEAERLEHALQAAKVSAVSTRSRARNHERNANVGQARHARLVVVDQELVRAKRDRKRIGVMLTLVAVFLGLLGIRIITVQVVQSDHWKAQAEKQSLNSQVMPASRGSLRDRNDVVLASDVPGDRIAVDPQAVENARFYAHALTSVLGIDESILFNMLQPGKLKDPKTGKMKSLHYRVLADTVDANTAEIIKEMKFPGIKVEARARRDYPSRLLGGSVLGYVQPSEIGSQGAAGAEFMYDAFLRGRPGQFIADRDVKGRAIPRSEQRNIAARSGSDVVMTLDTDVQYQSEQILLDQVRAQNALGGSVTVMDLTNGDIISMASVAGGRTKSGAHISAPTQGNQAAIMGYEPGSVMKIVTISSAIDRGCIRATDHFQVPQSMTNGGFQLSDDEKHNTELWTARDIITHSSNVGTAMIAKQCFTATDLDALLRRFGFGRRTGLGFPSEARGQLVDPSRYGDSGVASNAIGYGALVSPLQMLDAYGAVARGGQPITPRLARETIDANGMHHALPIRVGEAVVSPHTASLMRPMFANVVAEGTGICAAVPGFEVAGKTGTVKKRGSGGLYFASFVGFAPAVAPRIVAMVVIDDPVETYGGKAAAPVFSEVMTVALARLKIAPAPPRAGVASQFDVAREHARKSGKNCAVPHGDQLERIVAARTPSQSYATTASTARATSTTGTRSTTSSTGTTTTAHGRSVTTTTTTKGTRRARPRSTTTSSHPSSTTRSTHTTHSRAPTTTTT